MTWNRSHQQQSYQQSSFQTNTNSFSNQAHGSPNRGRGNGFQARSYGRDGGRQGRTYYRGGSNYQSGRSSYQGGRSYQQEGVYFGNTDPQDHDPNFSQAPHNVSHDSRDSEYQSRESESYLYDQNQESCNDESQDFFDPVLGAGGGDTFYFGNNATAYEEYSEHEDYPEVPFDPAYHPMYQM